MWQEAFRQKPNRQQPGVSGSLSPGAATCSGGAAKGSSRQAETSSARLIWTNRYSPVFIGYLCPSLAAGDNSSPPSLKAKT